MLGLHFAYVLFIVGGLLLVWLGHVLRWRWISNWYFRVMHLAAIALVAVEALVGITCPLTWLEDALRGAQQPTGLIARWVHALLFWDLPAQWFTLLYLVVAAITGLTFWHIPPRRGHNEAPLAR